ncbi:EAL domain-containing protein [Paenibacillus chartarius]|uniref:EAL domain-containing protein n=1 Tax=Paenibacillus chartarius TaxID=747481 RepID=A0ABV6DSW8_9BACL
MMTDDLMYPKDSRLKETDERYRSLFEYNPNAIFILDREGVCQAYNPAAALLLGGCTPDMQDQPLAAWLKSEEASVFAEACIRTWETGETAHVETTLLLRGSRRIDVTITLLPSLVQGHIDSLFCIVQDITQRKSDEMTINHLAYHDSLTGLPNRRLLQDRLTAMLSPSSVARPGAAASFAIMLLDLDGFKNVNDTLGHLIGDETIRYASMRLENCVRDLDLVARIGGDEFVVLLSSIDTPKQVAEIAERMIGELSKPFFVHGHSVTLSASVGIAMYPDDGDCPDSLLRLADKAMYRVKERGKNDYAFAYGEHQTIAYNSLAGMRDALAAGQFLLHYQPLMDTQLDRPVGFEALPRWRPDGGRLLLPDQFISIAEANGFIEPLTDWVLRSGCAQIHEWNSAWNAALRLHVNVSIRQLGRSRTANRLLNVLEEESFPPSLLTLEINETDLLHDLEQAARLLQELYEAGVRIAVDDFGSGYSPFGFLRRYPVHSIKLDPCLIRNIGSVRDSQLVTAITRLAEQLELDVVAEGVETAEQRKALPGLGCRIMQGYLFGMPKQAESISDEYGAI